MSFFLTRKYLAAGTLGFIAFRNILPAKTIKVEDTDTYTVLESENVNMLLFSYHKMWIDPHGIEALTPCHPVRQFSFRTYSFRKG